MGFFRLDAIDLIPRDDVDESTGRSQFRLHHPGLTVGCIAAKDWDEWNAVDSLIRNTKFTFEVRDRTKIVWYRFWVPKIRYVRYYGTLTVASQ